MRILILVACATVCYMKTITHREMRNNSADVLRRVAAGETLQVTNNGRPAALIVPIGKEAIERAIADGAARPARAGLDTLRAIRRTKGAKTSAEIIEDVRGRW